MPKPFDSPWRAIGLLAGQHRRGLAGALLLALGGFGATAFGVAVNIPEPQNPTQQLVSEMVAPLDIDAQIDLLAAHPLELYRTDVTRPGDSAASLLARLNIVDPLAVQFLTSDPLSRAIFDGKPGKSIRVRADSAGRLRELIARFGPIDMTKAGTHFSRLRIDLVGDRLTSAIEAAALATQVKVGSGTILSSLFAATDAANVPDAVASRMAEVLSGGIDFHRDLRKGDTFSVVYEALTADGERITWSGFSGRLLAVEFVNGGQRHSGVWYQDVRGKGGYYSLEGQSKRRSFLASPLEFSRVSSSFSTRMHPILNQWQQHRGVDYPAPEGTPVRCVGDGVVEFAGAMNGYGNVVEVRHGNERSTLYAHLSQINVKRGQQIEQGERVGAVGSTGWATGSHLHFEFKVAGVARNPTQLAEWAEASQLASQDQLRFAALARSIHGQIELTQSAAGSGVDAE